MSAAVIGIASSVVSGIFGGAAARRAKRRAAREAKRLQNKLNARHMCMLDNLYEDRQYSHVHGILPPPDAVMTHLYLRAADSRACGPLVGPSVPTGAWADYPNDGCQLAPGPATLKMVAG